MFDLEKAIAAWRRTLEHEPAVSAEDLRELEGHVRDQVEWLQAEGLTEEQALHAALRDVGDFGTTESEYGKVFWVKARYHHRLRHELMRQMDLITNALKVAVRSMQKAIGFTTINVLGLAVGLACCLLLALYVQDELRYDRFHENAGRIYRIVWDARLPDGTTWYGPVTPAPMAETLVHDVPEIEQAARLRIFDGTFAVGRDDRRFIEERLFFADSTLFDVFTLPLVAGDPRTALTEPNTLVLTETAAARYFGEADPIGQTMTIEGTDYRVTAVAEDVPAPSHVHFDLLASMASLDENVLNDRWFSNNFYTYLLLREGVEPAFITAKLEETVRMHLSPQLMQLRGITYEALVEAGGRWQYHLQPLTDIHLRSHSNFEIEPNGHITYVYAFSALALFILLLAGINFTNLATSRAAGRAKEVGLRKVLGSHRQQLVARFLTEAVLTSTLAAVAAVALALLALPAFNALAGKQMDAAALARPAFLLALPALVLIVGVGAGAYPAFFLSRYRPAQVLKGVTPSLHAGGRRLRGGLVVFQFTISVALIAGTLVIYRQVDFMQRKQLGFDEEHVLVVERAGALEAQGAAFKEQLRQLPGVTAAAYASHLPGRGIGDNPFEAEDAASTEITSLRTIYADYDFTETLRLTLTEGRAFSPAFSADSSAILLNETAVAALGLENPVGRRITRIGLSGPESSETFTVVGVVEDFHFQSLHQRILPLAILPTDTGRFLTVRLAPGDVTQALAGIEQVWQTFAPGEPFSYAFLDRDFDALYHAERRTGRLFGIFALLAAFVAGLGLFGLAAYTAEQRTKEIGIRKTLGASVSSLVALLAKDFMRLVLVAFAVAVPLTYVIMSRWLDGFAYRVDISWRLFLLTGLAALGIALVTVSYHTIRAALTDPVQTLRHQ